eukprot:TRINITY_DN11057_c1_g2_i1.p2 TRINITY_DN11057_c1_g2~~TRINITY_DN11057_c1_g2_i1.p2  ORF type:complete len:139 (-),score=22.34 TRINITY_DN11057_c1_g2_i1:78-494(-)
MASVDTARPDILLELGPQPVLLSNGNGWSNVTRFTTMAFSKLADMREKSRLSGASALRRCLLRVEQRLKREGLEKLRQRSNLQAFINAKSETAIMLRRLRGLVDSFELEIDDSVDQICRQTLEEDEQDGFDGKMRLKS